MNQNFLIATISISIAISMYIHYETAKRSDRLETELESNKIDKNASIESRTNYIISNKEILEYNNDEIEAKNKKIESE